jgi:adenylate cyclase
MKAFLRLSRNWFSTILIGILGAVFCQTNWAVSLEESWGLASLFQLRGAVKAPEKVVVISVDRASAEILRLGEDPEKWPRSQYARLVDKLNAYDPALIAFNIHFAEQHAPEDDIALATAMSAQRNIVLTSYIKQFSVQIAPTLNKLAYERIIAPVMTLEKAAIRTAPFPIPKSQSTVKQFWTYKNSVGDIATLPMAVFQCYLLKENYSEILQLLQKTDTVLYDRLSKGFDLLPKTVKLLDVLQDIQAGLENSSQSLAIFDSLFQSVSYSLGKKQLLQVWRSLINSHHSLYLNYYGGVGAVTTIPLYKVLAPEALDAELFRHKVILIGYSTDIEPDKNQGFYTVFSGNGEGNISPVEIAATAIANLIEGSWIRPLPNYHQFLLLMVWGSILSGIFRVCSYKTSISLIAVLSVVYLMTTYVVFVNFCVWLPLFTILFQTVFILLFESVFHIRTVYKVSERYLPRNVFNKNTQHPDAMDSYGELMHGVCMATDAGQYTALSERMNPMSLSVLMNKYYGAMFPVVKAHNGLISDVIGDAMVALWAKPVADSQLRIDACYAALKINALAQPCSQLPLDQLPTRIGLHYGEMRLGNVGAFDHYEYRAVGDIVNTATRIESLNKMLNTRILVSGTVIDGLSGFVSREVGLFLLKGKTQPIAIFELICKIDHIDPKLAPLIHAFVKALQLFQSYQWGRAQKAFLNINKYYPNDGPTLFYLHYLQKYQTLLQDHNNLVHKPVIDVANIAESWRYVNGVDNLPRSL